MKEIWKDIEGFDGMYQVSNLGSIKSLYNYNQIEERILSPYYNKQTGYYMVNLCKNGKGKTYTIHRLVVKAFIPNPDNLPFVNHKDENKLNNTVYINEDGSVDFDKSNLEWCTNKYNINYGSCSEKMRNAKLGKFNNKLSKVIIQYDFDGNFIKEWSSAAEIVRTTVYGQGNICACCRGERKTAYGYIWKFKEGA